MSENHSVDTSNRRDFLKASAVATGTALTANLAQAKFFAGGDETIKVGLIGCGGRGTGAAFDCLNADKGVQIVAIGDVFEDRLQGCLNQLKKNHPDRCKVTPETAFVGLDAYRKVINAGVDLVILATPPGFRPLHLEAAVKANKHIFTEKPVAVDGPGIRKCLAVYEEALQKKLAIVAGTQRRHQTGYIETIKRLHDGEIGDIVAGRCYWNMGDIWFRNRKPNQNDVQYQLHNWYHFLWLSGDHIVEQHVHNLDVINWVLRAHPLRATGMGGRSNRPVGDPKEVGNIFDHFAVELEYPNGVFVHSFCRQIAGCVGNVSEAVTGTKGASQIAEYRINGKRVIDRNQDNAPYVQEHIDLIRSIREGKPLNELKNVTESTLTAILGRMATYTGKAVTWEQALNSKEDTMPANLSLTMTELPTPPVPVPGKTKLI